MIKKVFISYSVFIIVTALGNNYGILPVYYNWNKLVPLAPIFLFVTLTLMIWSFYSLNSKNKRIWVMVNVLLILLIPLILGNFFFHGPPHPNCNVNALNTTVLPSNYYFSQRYCGIWDNISSAPMANLHALGGYSLFYLIFVSISTLIFQGVYKLISLVKRLFSGLVTTNSQTE